ncbi:unnamed protein product [Symbiodinium natans]|uniref:Uncharacterized protein n=1 Tax=Symbiodinium natans TaxID=878477 RepID=A0A812UM56_9DINO|nr:unnamed protein product [Symbiodinium natans]
MDRMLRRRCERDAASFGSFAVACAGSSSWQQAFLLQQLLGHLDIANDLLHRKAVAHAAGRGRCWEAALVQGDERQSLGSTESWNAHEVWAVSAWASEACGAVPTADSASGPLQHLPSRWRAS